MTAEPMISQNLLAAIVSPVGSTVLVATASIAAIAANPVRRGIIFANAGSVILYVCPSNIAAVIGQGIPIAAAAIVSFIGTDHASYTCGWNVIAASGSGNPLAILELL